MIIAGTIRNSVSLASLESKWQQKKQDISKGDKENLTAEERELQRLQEQAKRMAEGLQPGIRTGISESVTGYLNQYIVDNPPKLKNTCG